MCVCVCVNIQCYKFLYSLSERACTILYSYSEDWQMEYLALVSIYVMQILWISTFLNLNVTVNMLLAHSTKGA